MHAAPLDQLFAVVSGSGWVAGRDGVRVPLEAGEAVVFDTDEEHQAGSDVGMMVVVVEADDLSA